MDGYQPSLRTVNIRPLTDRRRSQVVVQLDGRASERYIERMSVVRGGLYMNTHMAARLGVVPVEVMVGRTGRNKSVDRTRPLPGQGVSAVADIYQDPASPRRPDSVAAVRPPERRGYAKEASIGGSSSR